MLVGLWYGAAVESARKLDEFDGLYVLSVGDYPSLDPPESARVSAMSIGQTGELIESRLEGTKAIRSLSD